MTIRILFNVFANANNVNAQSLNARDIALRLDRDRFTATLFFTGRVDPALKQASHIRVKRLPPRLRSIVIAFHLIFGRYDIVFYFPSYQIMTWYYRLQKLGKAKKFVQTIEGSLEQFQSIPMPTRTQLEWLLKHADACYAISPHLAKQFNQVYDLECPVIPVGVNTELFFFPPRLHDASPVKVLYVGSIQPRKRVHLLLDFAEHFDPADVEFHIIGDVIGSRDYLDFILQEKHSRGLDHVILHGKLMQAEVSYWMTQSDIFVLPSRLEGTPKVTFEAAAAGLPCLVFDDYQTISVIDGVTGYQLQTEEQMLQRLKTLVVDHELRERMGGAAVSYIQQFDWNKIVKKWEQVFTDLIFG